MLEWADRAVGAARSTSSEIAMDVATFRPDVLARFWSKVNKTDTCWLWTGFNNGRGYGQFIAHGKRMYAHRISLELARGIIPDDLEVDHLCRNRACVNPAHLEAVTHKENLARSPLSLGKVKSAKTHCPQGHPYSGSNLHTGPKGQRYCRTCLRARSRASAARSRAAAIAAGVPQFVPRSDRTHCPAGHEYAGHNLMVYSGKRYCRECIRARSRVYEARKREARGV